MMSEDPTRGMERGEVRQPRKRISAQPKGNHKKTKRSLQSCVKKTDKAKAGPSETSGLRGSSSTRNRTHSSKKVTTDTGEKDKDGNGKTRRRKVLNKSEKTSVANHARSVHNTTLSMLAKIGVSNQIPLASEDLKDFCDSLPVSDIEFLSEHLKKRFVMLYEECAAISAVSDRYLQFQLKWHHHCSYFLVDCNRELSMIGLHPSDPIAVDVVSVRSQWHHLSTKYSLQKERCKTFLILFCGCIYDELLRKCHSVIETSSPDDVQACVCRF